jgi:hypothetical protein
VGEVSYYCQLALIELGFLSAPQKKNLKDWVQANVRVVPRKASVGGHRGNELFPCFDVGNSFLKFTQPKIYNKY